MNNFSDNLNKIKMKKTFNFFALLLVGMFMLPSIASAQQMPAIPVDASVKIGKLPNGLTYYIRHNDYPKGQAEFFIAQKVGSINEEDDQRGLAHFLEHMCFNGTKSFPGNQVVSWLESVGVKFGANLNAYTSIDETVYNISNVPTARESVQDSCLLILHDWANDLLLADEEIDKERNVIHQEWRRSMVGQMRIVENLLPVMYPNSRYGYRLPIGTMEVVDNFPYQTLRDYYEKWYRPDLQGIFVVGDIDVDRIEAKIKEMFSDIEMPANPAERIYYPVADNKGTIYAIGRDKEQNNAVVELFFKTDPMPDSLKNTMAYLGVNYMTRMMSSMLNSRFNDIQSKPDAPFALAQAGYGEFFLAKTKDAMSVTGLAKGNDIKPVLAAIYREILRAQRGGFTATEYARARSEYLSRLETVYKNRNQRESGKYVQEYVRHFIDNEPIPGIEYEYQMMSMLANQIPVEAINMTFKQLITDDNRVLMCLLPEKDDFVFPSDADLDGVMKAVDAETIEAYVDNVKTEPLIANLPKLGAVVSETQNAQWDATEWTLSNGAKVIVKKTAFKDDEIKFQAVAKGGTSIFGDEYANSMIFMPIALQSYGLGEYTNADFVKYMAGKQASLYPSFSDYTRKLSGSTTPKDLPTLMEIIYMMFTDVNLTEDEFVATQNMYIGALQNQEVNPQYIFGKKVNESLYKNPRQQQLSIDVIKAAQRQQILDIAHKMLSNAADYTFVFVGNVDLQTLKPLVEQYIASLPGDAKTATAEAKILPELGLNTGKITDTFTTKMQTPQTHVAIVCFGDMPYNIKNQKVASAAGQILSARLIEKVREKECAVYSIWASGALGRISNNPVVIQSTFPMKPELKDKVLGIIAGEFDDMTKNVSFEELNKVKEYMIKDLTEGKEQNSSWLGAISGAQLNGVDTFNGAIEVVNGITEKDIQDFMKQLLEQNNYRVVILDPETETPIEQVK